MFERDSLLSTIGGILEQLDDVEQLNAIIRMTRQRGKVLIDARPHVYCIRRLWKGQVQWRYLSPHVGAGMSYEYDHSFLHVMTSPGYAEEMVAYLNRRVRPRTDSSPFEVVKISKEELPQRYLATQRAKREREDHIRDLIIPGRTISEILKSIIEHGLGSGLRWEVMKLMPEHLTLNIPDDMVEVKGHV